MELLKDALNVLAGDGVITAGTHAADKTTVSKGLSGGLKCSNSSEENVSSLEDITHDIHETERKDGGQKTTEDEESSTGVFPGNQVIEEAVEVSEGLVRTKFLVVALVETLEVVLGLQRLVVGVVNGILHGMVDVCGVEGGVVGVEGGVVVGLMGEVRHCE